MDVPVQDHPETIAKTFSEIFEKLLFFFSSVTCLKPDHRFCRLFLAYSKRTFEPIILVDNGVAKNMPVFDYM